MTDFATKHKVMPEGIASYNTEDAHTVFLQGRAAFGFGTGGLIGRIMRENPDMFDKVGILEVLEGPAGPERKLAAGFYQGLFVWKYSPNIDAAKTFIRWMTEPNRLEPIYKASPGTHWPIYKSGIDSDRVKTNRLLREALANVVPYTTDFAYPSTGVPEMGIIDGEKLFAAPGQPGRRRRQDAGAGRRRRGRGDAAKVFEGIAATKRERRPAAPTSRRAPRNIRDPGSRLAMLRQQRARFAYYLILPSVILITLLNVVPLIQGITRQPATTEHGAGRTRRLRRVPALSPRALRGGYLLVEPRPHDRVDRRLRRRRICRRACARPAAQPGDARPRASFARCS